MHCEEAQVPKLSMQWVRSLFRTSRRLVGTDLDGNKYYEVLRGASKKTRREVVTKQKLKHEDYQAGVIPIEWEAWLRGSVDNPPTHEVLLQKQQRQMVLSKRVLEVNRREKQRQEQEYSDGLVAKPVGHASSTTYSNIESSTEPRTSGSQFQPGVWDRQLNRPGSEDETEKYEPDAWKPP